jgi:hypothetical protein
MSEKKIYKKKTNMSAGNADGVEEYFNNISIKNENKLPIVKNAEKVEDENIVIPTIHNFNNISKYNYNLNQLKMIAKNYKLKISGNKKELISRIFVFLYLSSYAIKIQKIFRGLLRRKYNSLHGPAAFKRNLCTNSSDFISMEPIEDIEFNQFISYKDVDGFIYGFDITSLYNVFLNNGHLCKNPYNRTMIPDIIFRGIRSILRLSMVLGIHINLHIEDDIQNVSSEKAIELRALSLFQNIDALGNYSNPQWFLSLDKNKIIKFVRELQDIWNFRAQLSIDIKRFICPPNGDPFRNLSMSYLINEQNMNNVRKVILEVLEKFINSSSETDFKSLGAYYVLGALTLVNDSAASSLPWLYQSLI